MTGAASLPRTYGEEWRLFVWADASVDEYGRTKRSLVAATGFSDGNMLKAQRVETKSEAVQTRQGEERSMETYLVAAYSDVPEQFLFDIEDARKVAPVARSFTGALYDIVGVGFEAKFLGIAKLFLARRSDSERG